MQARLRTGHPPHPQPPLLDATITGSDEKAREDFRVPWSRVWRTPEAHVGAGGSLRCWGQGRQGGGMPGGLAGAQRGPWLLHAEGQGTPPGGGPLPCAPGEGRKDGGEGAAEGPKGSGGGLLRGGWAQQGVGRRGTGGKAALPPAVEPGCRGPWGGAETGPVGRVGLWPRRSVGTCCPTMTSVSRALPPLPPVAQGHPIFHRGSWLRSQDTPT